MIEENKNLLLKDLCARLPYNLYIRVEEFNVPENDGRITEGFIGNYLKDNRCNDYDVDGILNEFADGCIDVKPYLRPMSSMTDEERDDFRRVGGVMSHNVQNDTWALSAFSPEAYDWLNKNAFDYRGLIPMGLALESLSPISS